MNSSSIERVTIMVAVAMATSPLMADPPAKQARQQKLEEARVFVTGSLIPKRVKVQRIGTKTASPLRVIGRTEIDRNGRQSTSGLLLDDPSISVIKR